MKKYRAKIRTPWTEIGQKIEPGFDGLYRHKSQQFYPEKYPDCFEEIKEPLLVTEDGVELFEDCKVFGVNLKKYKICNCYLSGAIYVTGHIWFSTKQAAEKWIDENKPVFSKKQIRDAIKKHTRSDSNGTYIHLNLDLEFGLNNP